MIQKLAKDNNINISHIYIYIYIYALEQVISVIENKFSDSIDFTFPSQFVGFETIKYLMFYSSSCVLIQKNLVKHRGFKIASIILSMSRNALFVLEAVFVFSKKALSLRKKSCKKSQGSV